MARFRDRREDTTCTAAFDCRAVVEYWQDTSAHRTSLAGFSPLYPVMILPLGSQLATCCDFVSLGCEPIQNLNWRARIFKSVHALLLPKSGHRPCAVCKR